MVQTSTEISNLIPVNHKSIGVENNYKIKVATCRKRSTDLTIPAWLASRACSSLFVLVLPARSHCVLGIIIDTRFNNNNNSVSDKITMPQ